MTIGSLFSGIGGLELGLEWAGLGPTVWQVEKDAYCRAVLAKHWPAAERHEDVRAVGAALPWVDVICGGFPCQDVSGAGLGAGLAGARSGLWYEFARVVAELRPRWVVVENVASGARRWVDAVRGHLGELGYATLPISLSASDVGAPHRRARVFLVGHTVRAGREGAEPEQAEWRAVPPNGCAGVPDRDGIEVRHDEQRVSRRRESGVRDEGHPKPGYGGQALADCGGDRSGVVRQSDDAGERGEPDETGYVAHRRHARVAYPPFRDDVDGWSRYLEAGGPQPGVLPGSHGLPRGVARRRIAALGNSVVPECAEVVGWVIRELGADAARRELGGGR